MDKHVIGRAIGHAQGGCCIVRHGIGDWNCSACIDHDLFRVSTEAGHGEYSLANREAFHPFAYLDYLAAGLVAWSEGKIGGGTVQSLPHHQVCEIDASAMHPNPNFALPRTGILLLDDGDRVRSADFGVDNSTHSITHQEISRNLAPSEVFDDARYRRIVVRNGVPDASRIDDATHS